MFSQQSWKLFWEIRACSTPSAQQLRKRLMPRGGHLTLAPRGEAFPLSLKVAWPNRAQHQRSKESLQTESAAGSALPMGAPILWFLLKVIACG